MQKLTAPSRQVRMECATSTGAAAAVDANVSQASTLSGWQMCIAVCWYERSQAWGSCFRTPRSSRVKASASSVRCCTCCRGTRRSSSCVPSELLRRRSWKWNQLRNWQRPCAWAKSSTMWCALRPCGSNPQCVWFSEKSCTSTCVCSSLRTYRRGGTHCPVPAHMFPSRQCACW